MPRDPLRVLFFDYWTKGIHNFLRLMPHAPIGAAEFQLFHLGSFRDRSVPRYETVDGLPIVDIRAFRGMPLRDILKSLRPDVVVTLNVHTMFDRVLLQTCEHLAIPTVYLQHGAVAATEALRQWATSEDSAFRIGQYIRRIPKYARILPWYWRARPRSLLDSKFWSVLLAQARKPRTASCFPPEPRELWPTLALVFNSSWAEHLIGSFQLPRERVVIVGNPELDPAFDRLRSPKNGEERKRLIGGLGLDPELPILFYADEGFADLPSSGWTSALMAERMAELYEASRVVGLQMLVRPRASSAHGFETLWKGRRHVAVTREMSLVDSIDLASVVVGAMSSVLHIAVVLQKPILTPLWHINGQTNLSPVLKSGASVAVPSPRELADFLRAALAGSCKADTSEFFRQAIGDVHGNACRKSMAAILEVAAHGQLTR